ncbi:MAG: SIMPL domain-containing protein [Bacteriovorax sp.]|nr:SIMPL domain-containing protein [Bacteriovorax sp.]
MRKLFVLLFLTGSLNVFAADVRLITVTGSAEKSFKPDIVRVYLTAWGRGTSGKAAQSNSAQENEIIKRSLDTYKVKKEDVKTTSYNLNPDYAYDQKTGKSTITGYNASQEMVVVLRNIDDAGAFIDSLTTDAKVKNSGVNVNSFKFDLDKRSDEQSALLGDAVRASEAQAEVLAKAAKVKLKGVYRLSPANNGNGGGMMYDMAAESAPRAKGAAPTTFASGEIKITSEVAAEYIIE